MPALISREVPARGGNETYYETRSCCAELSKFVAILRILGLRPGRLPPGCQFQAQAARRDWGSFRYKKREFSIQEFMIYHHISCLSHDISLYIIYEIMIYHVPRDGAAPPGFSWLSAIGELVGDKPCAIARSILVGEW